MMNGRQVQQRVPNVILLMNHLHKHYWKETEKRGLKGMGKPKKVLVTALLLIVLPPLFIVMGGIPTLSELLGQGEGFAYFMAFLLLALIFIGVVFLLIGIGMLIFRRKT